MFLLSTIFDIFNPIQEEVWPDEPLPCYSQYQIVSICQSFRPVALTFSGKSTVFAYS